MLNHIPVSFVFSLSMSTLELKREAEAKVQQALAEQRILEKKLSKQKTDESDVLSRTANQREVRQQLEDERQKAQWQARLDAKRSQQQEK